MNLFQLVLKQMRQRSLSTWLTMLSVTLGVGLAIAVMIFYYQGGKVFGQSNFGYEVIVGHPGSPLQLVMNTVYQIDRSPGNIPYALYEEMLTRNSRYYKDVRIAVPYAVGDTWRGHRIIGTLPKLFGVDDEGSPLPTQQVLEYQLGDRYAMALGRVFHPRKFEAIVGSEIASKEGLKIGDKFHATHGNPGPNEKPDIHAEEWQVVGVLQPTHTASDRVLFIPLQTFYAISEHEKGLQQQAIVKGTTAPTEGEDEPKHYTLNPDGTVEVTLPKAEWQISAILIKARGSTPAQDLIYTINNRDEAIAVNPAGVMREFFETFLKGGTLVLLLVSALVTIVAAVGILVSIYNSVAARKREIAILRALGATRQRVLGLICMEAGLIGLGGGILGLIVGHLLGGFGSLYLNQLLGQRLNWIAFWPPEWLYLAGVVLLSVFAGLVPALKAYRTPVATNLVAG